jgi:hypothetical protein
MRRPRRVKIGPHQYTIRSHKGPIPDPDDPKGGDLVGYCDAEAGEILLSTGMSPSQTRDTLLHEILHAAFSLIGANLAHNTEERIVRSLAPAMLALLRENPALVAYLTERT